MMQSPRTNWLSASFACAALSILTLPTSAVAGKADNSVRFGANGILGSLDFYFNNSFIGWVLAEQVWDTLIYRDPKTGVFKGDLATNWRRVDDKTLELDLREGVKFHNGAAFDADDVVYTLNFVANPANGVIATDAVHWIDHVEKVSKYKVRIISKEVFPAAIAFLAGQNLVIYPHEYYAKVGPKGMSRMPIGTGPYRVVENAIGKYVRLERNPDYFTGGPKTRPKIDRVEVRFLPDEQTRVAETVAGGLDLITQVARDQAEQLRDVRGLQVVSADTMIYAYLSINARKDSPFPPLRDVRVRQAIMHAIDRGAIVKYIVGDSVRLLHTECFLGQFGCTDSGVPHYDYNPPKARRLLAEAGYPNGFTVDLYANNSQRRTETEAIINYLHAVGITARLRALQAAAIGSAVEAGRVGLAVGGWGTTVADVSDTVSVFHDFSRRDLSRDEEVRDLIRRGNSTLNPEARKQAYADAFRLIGERAYVLPLHSVPAYYLAAGGLTFAPSTDGVIRFYEMSWK